MATSHFSLPSGAGKVIEVPGMQVTVKIRKEHVAGAYSLLEYLLSPGLKGPAVHYHSKSDETFYVLEGQVRFLVNNQSVETAAGSVVLVPRGTPHTFSNPYEQSAKMLSIFSPGGFEGYFEEYAAAKEAGALREEFEKIRQKYDNLHL